MVAGSLKNGLRLAREPSYMESIDFNNLRGIDNYLQFIGQKKNIEILFCIIPNSGPTYADIKQIAELKYGVLTQCIKAATVNKVVKYNDASTISNILLKDNAKLNGTNHKLVQETSPILSPKNVMVIGADVTHPSPGQDNIPR